MARRGHATAKPHRARPSGGPRTAAGKRRTSQNARKHGLSLSVLHDAKQNGAAWRLARVIAGQGADDAMVAQAFLVAEAEITLQRIYRARIGTIAAAQGEGDREGSQPSAAPSDAVFKALPVLSSMDRYERRALSRQKKAWRRLNDLRECRRLFGTQPHQALSAP